MICRLLTTVFLLAAITAASAADCYVWQREHTPYVKRAVEEFHRLNCGRLYYLAGEIENSGKIIRITPPGYLQRGKSGAVIRIHVMEMRRTSPDKLAKKITSLFNVWLDAGCDELQIDLDAPERRIAYYTSLMENLRKILPNQVKLSATVLPCHLDHKKEFTRLAASVDHFVLQVHFVQMKGKELALFDYGTACKAVARAMRYRSGFKTALPLYTQIIRGRSAVCDWQEVAECAKFCRSRGIPVIGFRLGNTADFQAFDLKTAEDILQGKQYHPNLAVKLNRESEKMYTLDIGNNGYLSRTMKVQLLWKDKLNIADCDTLNGSVSDGSTPPAQLEIHLPFPGTSRPVLWIKTSRDATPDVIINIIDKERKHL